MHLYWNVLLLASSGTVSNMSEKLLVSAHYDAVASINSLFILRSRAPLRQVRVFFFAQLQAPPPPVFNHIGDGGYQYDCVFVLWLSTGAIYIAATWL